MSIKVQNYTNASISILTENEKILIDPWFTDGIYGGTWHNFPRLSPSEKKEAIDNTDICIFTHLHKDHFDISTVKKLSHGTLFIYPKTFGWQVIKSTLEANNYKNQLLLDFGKERFLSKDFLIQAVPPMNTSGIASQDTDNTMGIDGGFVITSQVLGTKMVFLADNNLYDDKVVDENLDLLREADLVAFAYSGFASDYPFNYNFSDSEKIKICTEGEESRLQKQVRNLKKINPKIVMPYSSEFAPVGKPAENWRNIFQHIWTNDRERVGKRYAKELNCKYLTLYPSESIIFGKDQNQINNNIYNRNRLLEDLEEYQLRAVNTNEEKEYKDFLNEEKFDELLNQSVENCISSVSRNKLKPNTSINFYIDKEFVIGIDFLKEKINRDEPFQEPFLNILLSRTLFIELLQGDMHWDDACLSMKVNWERQPNTFDIDTQNSLIYFRIPFGKKKIFAYD